MPWFNRAYRGLYGNRMIQFGNKISFAENKSRRTWKPNVQKTTLWSETLREKFPCRLTTYVMRCIRKKGGFDQYLLTTKNSEIKFPRAIDLKNRIRIARKAQRLEQEQSTSQGNVMAESETSSMSSITTEGIDKLIRKESVDSNSSKPLGTTEKTLMSPCRGLLDIL